MTDRPSDSPIRTVFIADLRIPGVSSTRPHGYCLRNRLRWKENRPAEFPGEPSAQGPGGAPVASLPVKDLIVPWGVIRPDRNGDRSRESTIMAGLGKRPRSAILWLAVQVAPHPCCSCKDLIIAWCIILPDNVKSAPHINAMSGCPDLPLFQVSL